MLSESARFNLSYLDILADQKTIVHRLDPRAKLLTTFVFLMTVISFNRYEVSAMVPFFIYPVFLFLFGNLPAEYFLKRLVFILPFILMLGIMNPVFDREIFCKVGTINISRGWISFLSIFLKSILTISASFALIATTGFYETCNSLRIFRVPEIFVVQLLFVYRYLILLIDEASRMFRAARLRTFSDSPLNLKVWTSLIGNLLLRSADRATRIHRAMLARGFSGQFQLSINKSFSPGAAFFFLIFSVLFIIMRFNNLSLLLGSFILTPVHPK
ncbi:MAG: cobalt ECF transporter T component CbiQ [Candidatus Riflebacteria bacterium]|nr:cobalt ECF transporter T component CbiQ [Candidatus Riflebacteria bacterium]